ncbi:MAG: ATP-dependent DNA helicase [Candidatus Paceibacterota bacterium]
MESVYLKRFKEEIAKLNPEQKEAVEAIEGPVMVVAGPGTGKTQILTLRIANILEKTDTTPEAILALTFTDSATANMKKRLVSIIGSRGYYATISTFHGFCNKIIQEYPEFFPEIIGGKSIDEIGRTELIQEIIRKNKFKEIKPFGNPYYYTQKIISTIKKLKNEGIAAADLKKITEKEERALKKEKLPAGKRMKEERRIRKNKELSFVYKEYQKGLRKKGYYDFEDMVLMTLKALKKNKDFLLELQETYQYILVDEHQDTNGAQNKVIELLGNFHENPNIFVVGDEKQAIFRFQGASLENFLFFKQKYKKAKLINLKSNYRSTQNILDAADSLIENNREKIPAKLKAEAKGKSEKIKIRVLTNKEEEMDFVAEKIKEEIKEGTQPEEIGVIFRENKDAEDIAEALKRKGINFSVESDTDIFQDREVQKLITLLSAVEKIGDDEKLLQALHLDFLKIKQLDIFKLLEAREKTGTAIVRIISDRRKMAEAEIEETEKIFAFFEKLMEWKKESHNYGPVAILEKTIKDSGFSEKVLSLPNYFEILEKVSVLFKEAKRMAAIRKEYSLTDFLEHLELLKEEGIRLKGKETRREGMARLMTAHKAKGLEFDVVFIIGARDGHFGNKRTMEAFQLPNELSFRVEKAEKNEDERRLFYMAITRARKKVFITYPEYSEEGKEQAPSQFIEEIKKELKEERKEEKKKKEFYFLKKDERKAEEAEKSFLKEKFLRKGLSVTALNNYLECPWKFFYESLIKMPKMKMKQASFGTATHEALNRFFNKKRKGEKADSKFILKEFERALKLEGLREEDFESALSKGKRILPDFYNNYKDIWNYNTKNEVRIRGEFFDKGIILNGMIDKMEFITPTSQKIDIVDYKTGKPKSRNEIEGKTKTSGGEYKRQLVFYKILLQALPQKFILDKAILDFVEPTDGGKFRKEYFEISEKETEDLKKEIERVWEEILNFSFWNERCQDKKCKYCRLREFVKHT